LASSYLSTLVVIPAYQAERHLGAVLAGLLSASARQPASCLLVVDDGSTDATTEIARSEGVEVVRHAKNQGKGAALRTGLCWAASRGFHHAVTADADGQHPADEILRLVSVKAPSNALVLGIRDLMRDGAPRPNRFSNGISNRFLSLFTGLPLRDTQCGLRRYPVRETLLLGCKDASYAFEAEVLLRAARTGLPILQLPIRVNYPQGAERLSHFHVIRDPFRIVSRVLLTLVE
jgi:glycosyltransferase involved in cell wall biosynthesis